MAYTKALHVSANTLSLAAWAKTHKGSCFEGNGTTQYLWRYFEEQFLISDPMKRREKQESGIISHLF